VSERITLLFQAFYAIVLMSYYDIHITYVTSNVTQTREQVASDATVRGPR
jgi:hypothetical protein